MKCKPSSSFSLSFMFYRQTYVLHDRKLYVLDSFFGGDLTTIERMNEKSPSIASLYCQNGGFGWKKKNNQIGRIRRAFSYNANSLYVQRKRDATIPPKGVKCIIIVDNVTLLSISPSFFFSCRVNHSSSDFVPLLVFANIGD